MTFTEEQIELLQEKLSSEHVSARKQNGISLSYLEGYHVIDEANRIFGFGSWSHKVLDIKVVAEQDVEIGAKKAKGLHVGVIAHVEVEVNGVVRQDVGFGDQRATSKVAVYEMAYKEAVTDALKRALRTFGNQFGNALYDKEQKNVTSEVGSQDKPKASKGKSTKEKTKGTSATSKTAKKTTSGKDFKGMIDELKTEEEFLNFRKEYKSEIKAAEDSKEIVNYFNTKMKDAA